MPPSRSKQDVLRSDAELMKTETTEGVGDGFNDTEEVSEASLKSVESETAAKEGKK